MHKYALVIVRLETLTGPPIRRLESSYFHKLQYIGINLKSVLSLLPVLPVCCYLHGQWWTHELWLAWAILNVLQSFAESKPTLKYILPSLFHILFWSVFQNDSFSHSIGMCRIRRFLAIFMSFFHSSLLCTFSCHPSPPTILPSSLTPSCHLFLGLHLNLVVPKFIYNTVTLLNL